MKDEGSLQKNDNGVVDPNRMLEEKPNDNGTKENKEKDVQMILEFDSALSENLKESVGGMAKFRNKLPEETKSNASKSRSSSIDRLNNSIRMQLKLNSAENSSESGDERSVGEFERVGGAFDKRRASQDLNADIEAFANDPQKKVKLDNDVVL